MKITFDTDRYNELLEKEKRLNQQNNSLIFENKDEFIELLSYGARVQDQISYGRKEDYYSLISQYIEKVVTPPIFQSEFLKMEKEDAKAAKIITNDFKQLASFSVNLKAMEFSSLIEEISDLSMVAQEFGPEEGISDQKFRKSIEKTFLQMQDFFEEGEIKADFDINLNTSSDNPDNQVRIERMFFFGLAIFSFYLFLKSGLFEIIFNFI